MKYILSFFTVLISIVNIGVEPKIKQDYINPEYLQFLRAYEHVRSWEGNYSNLEFDAGGETYAGITRNYNQDWAGWQILDNQKNCMEMQWNTLVPELEEHVIDYYYKRWLTGLYHKIKDPLIAAYLFDYANTGIIAIKHAQKILIEYGNPIKVTYKLDMKTINAINKMNPTIFLLELKEIRKNYYLRVTEKKPQLEIYLKGWMNRAESIIS